MNTTPNDIRKFLIRNSIITYSSVLITITVLVLHFLTTNKAIEESRKYLYMIQESGEIVPLEWVERRDNLQIEIKHHLSMFVSAFYSLNTSNWEDHINKALYLADVETIHQDRENKGYYNRFIQYNIEQSGTLPPTNIELEEIDKDSYEFRIIIALEESYNKQKIPYLIFAKGKIRPIPSGRNFPHNPHGLWIYDYVEESIEKIENQ